MPTDTPTAVVPAAPADLDNVCSLLITCGLPTDGLADHMTTCLVIRCGEDITGSVALELYGKSALLRSLAVHPESRSTGLGKALTAAALELAAERAVSDVYLLTETAPQFFSSLGFNAVERSDVPAPVHQSLEFTTACPDTALAMHLALA